MIARIASSLLPCPLCGGGGASASGTCRSCSAGLDREAGSFRIGGMHVAWLGPYRGSTLRAVRAVKFGGRLTLAHTLGRRLGRQVSARRWPVARVVPVPLHRTRRWRRGYDQADCLARGVARALKVPLTRSLRRVRGTSRQARAGRASRHANVADAFRCTRLPPVPILLVDDVWTTGATARACGDALRAAGAREVRVAVVARAGPEYDADAAHNVSTLAVAMPSSPPTITWG